MDVYARVCVFWEFCFPCTLVERKNRISSVSHNICIHEYICRHPGSHAG